MIGAIEYNLVNLFEIEGGGAPGYRVKTRHLDVAGFDEIDVDEFHEFFNDEDNKFELIESEGE